MQTVQIDYDPDVAPAFAFAYAFNKPNDWAKTYDFSLDEYFMTPLQGGEIVEEGNLYFCDSTPIYVRYVSNSDSGFGLDLSRWPGLYARYVAMELAWRACPKTAGSSDSLRKEIEEHRDEAKSNAMKFEALREPMKRPPAGNWNASRFRGRSTRDPTVA
jgi:hypothetical protein